MTRIHSLGIFASTMIDRNVRIAIVLINSVQLPCLLVRLFRSFNNSTSIGVLASSTSEILSSSAV